jgi:Flp pilus assembly protein TadD
VLDPRQKLALNLRATQLIEMRNLDQAEEILEVLAPRAGSDHSILNTIGMLRFEQGNFPAAIRRFEQAVKLNPFVPEFQYNLALSYEYAGSCDNAEATWLSYLQSETHEQRLSMVRERLRKNFATEGGRCFGVD